MFPVYEDNNSCGYGLWSKKLLISEALSSAPVQVPSRRPLARSIASVKSVDNDEGDNEMILWAVHRSPGICLWLRKTSASRPSDESAMQAVIASKWGWKDCTAHQEGRRKERRRGWGWAIHLMWWSHITPKLATWSFYLQTIGSETSSHLLNPVLSRL